jgi:hypothetical protein
MLLKLGHYLEETEFFIYSTTGLTGLKTLDLFGARITDHGMAYLKRESSWLLQDLGFINSLLFAAAPQSAQLLDDLCLIFLCTWNVADFKNLQTLELCGGGITDAGVRSIKDLTSLTSLNLSQNPRLTDNALQYLSGINSNQLSNFSNTVCHLIQNCSYTLGHIPYGASPFIFFDAEM